MSSEVDRLRRPGRLMGAVFNYGVGGYVPQLVNFLLIPVYTRVLTPGEMGAAEILITASGVLAIAMKLGLPGAITRLYFDCDTPEAKRDLITTVALAVVAGSIAVGAIIVGAALLTPAALVPEISVIPHVPLVVGFAALHCITEVQRRVLQAREQSALTARLSFASGALGTSLNVLLVVVLKAGVDGILWANLLSTGALAAFAVWYHRADLRGRFRAELLKAAASYGLPHVPHHGAAWVQQYGGRWMLMALAGAAAVGHFGLAARLASPLAVAIGAFATAYPPVYFSWRKSFAEKEAVAHARRTGRWVVVLGGVAAAGAALLGAPVVRHLAEGTYARSAPAIGPVAAALFGHLVYTLVVVELFQAKRTKSIAVVFITSAAVNLTTLALLPTGWGAVAAGLAQLAGAFTSVGVVAVLARRTFALPLDARAAVTALGLVAWACVASSLPAPRGAVADFANAAGLIAVTFAVALFAAGARGDLGGIRAALPLGLGGTEGVPRRTR